jgi:hypothetical protein
MSEMPVGAGFRDVGAMGCQQAAGRGYWRLGAPDTGSSTDGMVTEGRTMLEPVLWALVGLMAVVAMVPRYWEAALEERLVARWRRRGGATGVDAWCARHPVISTVVIVAVFAAAPSWSGSPWTAALALVALSQLRALVRIYERWQEADSATVQGAVP